MTSRFTVAGSAASEPANTESRRGATTATASVSGATSSIRSNVWSVSPVIPERVTGENPASVAVKAHPRPEMAIA